MSEQQNRRAYPDDEFDIEVLAGKLWRINKKLWTKLFYPVTVLLANTKRLALALAIAAAAAILLRFTLPATYQSGFIIKPINTGDMYFMGLLHDLDIMLKDKNYPDVARMLKVDEATAEQLKRVDLQPIFKNEVRRDTINAVEVVLLMEDARLIDTFQNSILNNYLEKNPYYTKARQMRSSELLAMEDRLLKDLKENDSLKKVLTLNAFPRGTSGGFVYGEPIDPVRVHELGLKLYEKYVVTHSLIQYNLSFELVKPGIVRIKPYFPRLIILLPATVLVALTVCFVMNLRQQKYAD